ncbi:DEAD/DEAH box helicase [Falsarthrobacter nasiphocae]|uniref:ATP-dependent Lhr-like helicase n=1 Tax=Falsarthrobacter nasiphocae TaxID=189863 RepID=A0AAE4C5T7_9MICC|nr:DEAD/DEAH box helicase [Falsarthrobacter nasiphocae]MDR6891818.1 ATP-dependent Lhr-like helicase [Falsarthrobacter nasiphocae]
MPDILERFTESTRRWFLDAFSNPTPAQAAAWEAVSGGQDALVVAPTGSGKTLSAFLWALDGFFRRAAAGGGEPQLPGMPEVPGGMRRTTPGRGEGTPPAGSEEAPGGTRVLYISPLKALGVDVERNLRSPLIGIRQTALRLGLPAAEVTVGVRSGDTPPNERRRLATHPPDILITTPESLFLILTSKSRGTLANVDTIILDEVHAIAGTKRGAHLAVSLARLDAYRASRGRPRAQRIGLSATVEPRELVAEFLSGGKPCAIVAPPSGKIWDLTVTVPVEDLASLGGGRAGHTSNPTSAAAAETAPASTPEEDFPTFADTLAAFTPPSRPALTGHGTGAEQKGSGFSPDASIWPHIEERLVDLILEKRSTIVFANSRRLAERLTGRLNEIYADRLGFGLEDPWAPSSPPAQVMAQAGASPATPEDAPLLARAHHGSVSKDQRSEIEEGLKRGDLRCVVATSSLELGIDMGLVDQVLQVESPPSVASGLQRVGRAGHGVGEVSRGVFYPKHRGDLLTTSVTVMRMLEGRIEPVRIPRNPLDILAQQTVAACALEPIGVEDWYTTLTASAPFLNLPRSAYEATLDLLSGRYPSDEFAGLRPRIVWDRVAGTLEGRPGAQRLAVTSGGTIPDRGLFGVFLASADGERGGKRVGELDEEMVYESRVGDVFALGATSWRIVDITHDRVLVTPAFGEPGKLPFWHGDAAGRPVELGRALGEFLREAGGPGGMPESIRERLRQTGLDPFALGNLERYLEDQRSATGAVPTERTLVVERFKDEIGDWRIVLHSPYGMPVHAPWALAVGARVRETHGMDASAMAADDGIILRVPAGDGEPPGAELFLFEPDEIEDIVTREVGGSALFAARFRECAARALLLPRRDPGKRTPLWQQRQRSSQLLQVARSYPSFPIILETVRECLQDVYDLPALVGIFRQADRREIAFLDVSTPEPSPFAKSLLFGYVATFLYEGDAPLAERRAAALAMDPALLNELLGRVELRELLDEEVVATVEGELQRTLPDRRLVGAEGAADLLRLLGPLTIEEAAARMRADRTSEAALAPAEAHAALEELAVARRAFVTRLAGRPVYAAVEDAARLRDALGAPIPHGVPVDFLEPVDRPVEDLVARDVRTHATITIRETADRLGLGRAVVRSTLATLVREGRVVEGAFRPTGRGDEPEFCDADVLRSIRRRSLARLRKAVEPVDSATLGRFVPAWHHILGASQDAPHARGTDAVILAAEQLTGAPLPASALESLILPSRVPDYAPSMLDELLAAGELVIQGHGAIGSADGWVSLHLAETAELTLAPPQRLPPDEPQDLPGELLARMLASGASFPRALAEASIPRTGLPVPGPALSQALWELFWSESITVDSFAPVRARLNGGGRSAHATAAPSPRARTLRRGPSRRGSLRAQLVRDTSGVGLGAGSAREPETAFPSDIAARWSLLPAVEPDPTLRIAARTHVLLDRHGVLTRGAVATEDVPGGFSAVYRVASRLEETGAVRRGYFVEKLGASQFAAPETVDGLRAWTHESLTVPGTAQRGFVPAVALASTDPANAYGASLPWPETEGHRPGRKAGAVVVLVDGELCLYVERGGRSALTFSEDAGVLARAAQVYAAAVQRGRIGPLSIEKVNGEELAGPAGSPFTAELVRHGFYATPKGVKYRP